MKAKMGTVLAGLLLLAGCATKTPDVTTHYDTISGLRTDLMSDNMLETPQQPPREVVWLNASRVFRDLRNSRGEYYLEVNYEAREETGFLNIPVGATLTVVADGRELRFIGNGSFNQRKKLKRGLVYETALYKVTRDNLLTIANAKQVKVKIRGDNGLVERDFSAENFKRFQEFMTNTRV
ncbi:MAG TPA: hypothetical protein VGE41_13480 [Verrucomicrobiae bacterium]|jgi:hypothetical protein